MKNVLELPQLSCVFGRELPKAQLLLVAGGRRPAADWLAQVAGRCPVWCVDRGIEVCRASKIRPERLIGDGDSAARADWAWGKELGIPVDRYPPEKTLTDLQLALQTAGLVYGKAVVVVTGVWGGRFDHAFSNIYSLKGGEGFGLWGCCAADEREALILLKGGDSAEIKVTAPPQAVSLLPLGGHCSGVCIDGVHWPLDGVELQDSLPYAVSNRLAGTQITVSIKTGWLGIYFCWDEKSLAGR